MDNTISFILGAVAGFFINKFLEVGTKAAASKIRLKRLKKKLKGIQSIDEKLNIVTLSSGVPKYNLKDCITIKNSNKSIYIDFPEDKKLLLDREISFHTDISFNGESNFEDIVKQTGIENLVELINKYRNKVADDFINKNNGCHFNGEKYGVYSIEANDRRGNEEEPIVNLKTFTTDYFTHKIFKEIYKELASKNHDISKVNDVRQLGRYNVFNTSLGVNGIVKVNSQKGKSFILTKRSNKATTNNGEEWYGTSFTEGISQTDYDYSKNVVSLLTGIKRGLEEEIGIPTEGYYSSDSIEVYDFFLEKEFFEIGVTCGITLNENINFEEHVKDLPAKDKSLETSEIFTIENSMKSVQRFLEERKDEIYSRSAYTIHSVAIREYVSNIFI
ncbi:hypothetical protein [Clostridium sp.]|uniref:hypothetical protein n=1 Tax=Clostridium sp. TaxID=1506 RepID=UPI00261EC8E3|nr:hypothetical protein [Clostridium sp.]